MQFNTKNWCGSGLLQIVFLLLVIGVLTLSTNKVFASPGSANVGVIFPTVREPYQGIFKSIIDGVEQQTNNTALNFSLEDINDEHRLNEWIIENNLNSIITLGRLSHRLTQLLSIKLPITTGAVLMSPDLNNKIDSGIVLNPDPELVIKQLRQLAPNIKKVIVIYNPDKNSWLINRAKQATSNHNIKLIAYHVTELYKAAMLYRDIFKMASNDESAIWLLNDNSVFDNNAILPLILQEAWDKNILVFSNNPAHVKRGVLFALYPNNIQMGKSLAKLAVNRVKLKASENRLIHPLSDLLIAFNLRTAEHLRLNITRKQRNKFDLVFPAQ